MHKTKQTHHNVNVNGFQIPDNIELVDPEFQKKT